jgi:hypothetical protein
MKTSRTFTAIGLALALSVPLIGGTAPAAAEPATKLAQMPAPTGHRQPTKNDIPPSVRQDETPNSEATPEDGRRIDGQRSSPNALPDGVPRICNNC